MSSRTDQMPYALPGSPITAARACDETQFSQLIEPYRRELHAHCYRMLGSLQEADDLLQETFLRAWQRLDTFEGRAPFRAWLYKIATNVCLDVLERRPRRTLPQTLRAPADGRASLVPPVTEPIWLEPIPDDLLADVDVGPDARYSARESITLAFLVALQALPPRQRAALILCDVLDWQASEASNLLGLTVSAVNSALHRARVTLASRYYGREPDTTQTAPRDNDIRVRLDRYVRAWESANVDELVALLKADVVFSMPPLPSWYRGQDDVRTFVTAHQIFGADQTHRWLLYATRANRQPAFAVYQRDVTSGLYEPFAIQVLTMDREQIAAVTSFMNPTLFARFGFPQVATDKWR